MHFILFFCDLRGPCMLGYSNMLLYQQACPITVTCPACPASLVAHELYKR